jgi:hypothetical protein
MSRDAKELINDIDSAFAVWSYPGDAEILRDDVCEHGECDVLRKSVVGKHWAALKIGDVAYKDSLVLYMTPAGYRYYLPGLMKLSLLNPEIYDLPAYIAAALTPPNKDHRPRGQWSREYKEAFTYQQQQVIRDFLLWANARFESGNAWDPAGLALSAVWNDQDARQ